MKKIRNKPRALLVSSQMLRSIEPLLADLIRKKLNFEVTYLTKTQEDKNFYKKYYGNFFNKIEFNEKNIDAIEIAKLPKIDNLEEKALAIEKKYDISIYRLFIANRVLGRGFFASGGCRHPKNRRHQVSNNKQLLTLAITELEYWENFFLEDNIKLAINLPPHAHRIALKFNINSFRFFEGRFKDYYAWFTNFGVSPKVSKEDLKKVSKRNLKKVTINKPYTAARIARVKDLKSLKLLYSLKGLVYKSLKYIYGRYKGFSRTNNSYFLDEILYSIRYRKGYYACKKYVKSSLNRLEKKVYFFSSFN